MSDFSFLRRSETSEKYKNPYKKYSQRFSPDSNKHIPQFHSIFNEPKSSLMKIQNPKKNPRLFQSLNSSPIDQKHRINYRRKIPSYNKLNERENIINYDNYKSNSNNNSNFSTLNPKSIQDNNNYSKNLYYLNNYKDPNETIYKNPSIGNSFNILNNNIFLKGSSSQIKDQIGDLLNFENRENLYSYMGNSGNANSYNTFSFTNKRNNTNSSLCKEKISNNESTDYFIKDAYCIKEYAYKEEPNLSFRDQMEDKAKSVDCFNRDYFSGLFCIFDGHGGSEVSQYLQNNFISYMKEKFYIENNNNFIFSNEEIEKNLKEVFNKIDEKFAEDKFYAQIGSTACVVYICKTFGKKNLFCANIGDTRCILINNEGGVKRLSYDDRATDPNEADRVKRSRGVIFGGRVYGQLMLTRAFGDSGLKKYGVIGTPHVNRVEINYTDKYCVIASDGVWDVLSDEEVSKLSLECKNAKEFCDLIVQKSVDKKAMDNISCFVLRLN